MSASEWEETANLVNEIVDQLEPIVKAVTAKASTPRISISVVACLAASTAHQAAGMALKAASDDEKAAYDAALDHVMKVIGLRYAESIAFARSHKVEHPAGAVH